MRYLPNKYYESEKTRKNKGFKFNKLNGLNNKGSPNSKINIKGHLDNFTFSTLYKNYESIAHNLKVYPTITIYPRDYELKGGMAGFYYPDRNHIDIIDHYYLITILSHEMRHAYQYIYFPDLYFSTEYKTAREYLNCNVERDARKYSLDYCTAKGYREEAAAIKDEEHQIDLIIHNKLSPSAIGISDKYFNSNPCDPPTVSRDYHWNTGHDSNEDEIIILKDYRKAGNSFGKWIQRLAGTIFAIALLYFFIIDSNDTEGSNEHVNLLSSDYYIIEQSATKHLSDEDVAHLSTEELRLARNEIYARHGFMFNPKDLKTYFTNQSWYIPNPEFSEGLLSDIEHFNISLILSYER